MCAIVGFIRNPSKYFSRDARDLVSSMLSKMIHRGPDGTGISEFENVVLGHNRLSIIGIDNGKQPISSERTTIVVNGEFYRHEQIKKDLFPTREWITGSDSEILIPLYETFGIDKALSLLDGEFAFILHDKKTKKIYAARDRFGVKPLTYRETSIGVEIASEVKAFQGSKSWNEDALCTSLAMHYQNARDTIARGIFNILPGHYLEIDAENGTIINEKRWWKPSWPNHKLEFKNKETIVEKFKNLMENAVKARMRSDARWCIALSGGVDSSSVLGFARTLSSKPAESFTVTFPDAGKLAYNELEIARKTAKFTNSTLHEVEMPASKILDLLEESIQTGEGFAVNGHISCKHALAQEVHKLGFKSILVGEGADECLLGYSHLKVDQFDGLGASRLMAGTETPCGSLLMPEKFSNLPFIPSFIKAKLSSGKKIESVLDDDFKQTFKNHALSSQTWMISKAMENGCSRSEKTMSAWLTTAFPTYICKVLGDSQEMASSVEARLPFLDKDLFEFSASLPLNLKSTSTSEKMVLRDAVKDLIPNEVRLRPKQPFQAPPLSYLLSDEDWNKFVGICLDGERCQIFNKKKLEQKLSEIRWMTIDDQAANEPVAMLAASCSILSRNLSL